MMKKTSSLLVKTSFAMLYLIMMETQHVLMLEMTGSLMLRTSSVMVCPMTMMTNPVKMRTMMMIKRLTRGEQLVEVQDNFVCAEENTMNDVRVTYIMSVTCPMGGSD